MATQIHGAGPSGQRSPGLNLAIAGYLTDNPPAGGGGASELNDLTDVDTTGATTGDVLKYDGSEWSPDAPSAGTAFELRGTGMPNDVVTANPGTYYTDTAGTNGAWRWLKKSGTGNTGWEVIVGDTGWRELTIDAAWDETSVTKYVHVRRVNEQTILYVRNISHPTDNTGSAPLLTLASGFRPPGTLSFLTSTADAGYVVSGGLVNLPKKTGGGLSVYWQFATASAWPTTLPGSPA